MQVRRFPIPFMTLFATSTTEVFFPGTPWMESASVDELRAAWELISYNAQIEITPAWQVANSEENPGAVQTVLASSPYKSDPDVYFPVDWRDASGDATAPTKSNLLIRFGFLVYDTRKRLHWFTLSLPSQPKLNPQNHRGRTICSLVVCRRWALHNRPKVHFGAMRSPPPPDGNSRYAEFLPRHPIQPCLYIKP